MVNLSIVRYVNVYQRVVKQVNQVDDFHHKIADFSGLQLRI